MVALADVSYDGVLLPYWEGVWEPEQLRSDISASSQGLDGEPAYCFAFIKHAGGVGGPDIPQIEDAERQFPGKWSGNVAPKLPRLLEFPPSNATGLANLSHHPFARLPAVSHNPFARLPAEDWWGNAYGE